MMAYLMVTSVNIALASFGLASFQQGALSTI